MDCGEFSCEYCSKDKCIYMTDNKIQPKMGYWINLYEGFSLFKCSKCETVEYKKSNYCPNCGAKMVEPKESEISE